MAGEKDALAGVLFGQLENDLNYSLRQNFCRPQLAGLLCIYPRRIAGSHVLKTSP